MSEPATPLPLVLFVAGASPNARAALANLEHALAVLGRDRVSLQIVDVEQQPDLALAKRVLVTPTLLRDDATQQRLVGDLSARQALFGLLS